MQNTIYHYTSPGGLRGILTSDDIHLFFTHLSCLNDLNEGKEAINVLRKVCKILKDEEKIGVELYEELIKCEPSYRQLFATKNGNDDSITIEHLSTVPFVCCFSTERDSLPMWNYYSKGSRYEGYNIGLGINREGEFKYYTDKQDKEGKNNPFGRAQGLEVIYNDSQKFQEVEKFILKKVYMNYTTEEIKNWVQDVLDKEWAITFKSKAFEHEREYRFVIYVPEELVGELASTMYGNRRIPINFRDSHGLIIPYIDVWLDKTTLKNVTVGPLLESDFAKRTVAMMLKERQYDVNNVQINASSVPIRF